jgi:hypothetical protein
LNIFQNEFKGIRSEKMEQYQVIILGGGEGPIIFFDSNGIHIKPPVGPETIRNLKAINNGVHATRDMKDKK